MSERSDVRVSVLITTFNHAAFIAAAIESALSQRVDGSIEVIVGDDASSDGTRGIIEQFRQRHPRVVRVILPDQNLGANGANLALRLLGEAGGEYIAWLDGDDYWLGTAKLERQMEWLDAHPECSGCFHRALNLYPDGSFRPYEQNFDVRLDRQIYSLTDLMFENFVPTAALMFRRRALGEIPAAYHRVPSPDWFLNLLLMERGNFGFLGEVWAVRRVHAGGVISMKSPAEKIAFNIRCVTEIDRYLGRKYHSAARLRLAYLHHLMTHALQREGRPWRARWHALQTVAHSPRDNRWARGDVLAVAVGARFGPRLDRWWPGA